MFNRRLQLFCAQLRRSYLYPRNLKQVCIDEFVMKSYFAEDGINRFMITGIHTQSGFRLLIQITHVSQAPHKVLQCRRLPEGITILKERHACSVATKGYETQENWQPFRSVAFCRAEMYGKYMKLALTGLGTMGANLARNAARKGHSVVVHNRTPEKTDAFLKKFTGEGQFTAAHSPKEVCAALTSPRVIILMVKAGDAVDEVIAEFLPHLGKGDILIDAGNSHYRDTERREKSLSEKGIHFVGMGVSGGEEGALLGPSIMPGGSTEAYKVIEPLLLSIAADDGAGGKCVTHVGKGGAGHFVKMVHNGIEYGIMQILCEAYHLLKSVGFPNSELAAIFKDWSTSDDLQSFLTEITSEIFTVQDKDTGNALVDMILDAAGQKGTGKWTTDCAMSYGVAVPTITAAVDARIISSGKEFRKIRSRHVALSAAAAPYEQEQMLADVRHAVDCSILNDYAQGFQLIETAGGEESWNINASEVARIWRGGCIIRGKVTEEYQLAFAGDQTASTRLRERCLGKAQMAWRRVVSHGALAGIPLPAISASLSYFDAYRTERLPQNLLQAQRDHFGAHTFRRTDKAGVFHADWKTGISTKISD